MTGWDNQAVCKCMYVCAAQHYQLKLAGQFESMVCFFHKAPIKKRYSNGIISKLSPLPVCCRQFQMITWPEGHPGLLWALNLTTLGSNKLTQKPFFSCRLATSLPAKDTVTYRSGHMAIRHLTLLTYNQFSFLHLSTETCRLARLSFAHFHPCLFTTLRHTHTGELQILTGGTVTSLWY